MHTTEQSRERMPVHRPATAMGGGVRTGMPAGEMLERGSGAMPPGQMRARPRQGATAGMPAGAMRQARGGDAPFPSMPGAPPGRQGSMPAGEMGALVTAGMPAGSMRPQTEATLRPPGEMPVATGPGEAGHEASAPAVSARAENLASGRTRDHHPPARRNSRTRNER